MKAIINFSTCVLGSLMFLCCKPSLPVSKFSKYNKYEYKTEQPNFYFQNDKLAISGNWWWAGQQKVIPKISYLPDSIKMMLMPYVQQHGPVLFSTFNPNSKNFPLGKSVIVLKKDVRRKHRFIDPFYETVLVSKQTFDRTKAEYMAVNSNSSYSIFTNKKIKRIGNYVILEVIAAEETKYYDFVCIFDKVYIKNERDSAYQMSSFIDDIYLRFNKVAIQNK